MAMQSDKTDGSVLSRGGAGALAAEKPRSHEELGLCLALVVLLGWALFVGVRAVDWAAVSHTFRSLLAFIS
jgi:hypothetical protein